jgi:hypothetical protein
MVSAAGASVSQLLVLLLYALTVMQFSERLNLTTAMTINLLDSPYFILESRKRRTLAEDPLRIVSILDRTGVYCQLCDDAFESAFPSSKRTRVAIEVLENLFQNEENL